MHTKYMHKNSNIFNEICFFAHFYNQSLPSFFFKGMLKWVDEFHKDLKMVLNKMVFKRIWWESEDKRGKGNRVEEGL